MWVTFLEIAWKNITRRTKVMGSLFFCVLAGVFSVVLVWSSYDVSKKGTELSRVRMSADVMVYPYETELSDVSMLYSGIAQSVYMDAGIAEQLSNGYVEKVVSQFYLQTLPTEGCCTVTKEMRLVGVDWEEDVTIRSYLKEGKIDGLNMKEVVLGSNVDIEGDTTLILNMPVQIVGVLENTGTYLDDSILLSMEQLRQLAKVNFPPNYFQGRAPEELITCALVELKEGADPQKYIESIEGVEARKVLVSSTADTVQSEISVLFRLLAGAVLVILLLCIAALGSQIQSLVHSRYCEIGYLRSIGVRQSDIYKMFVIEIGAVAAAAGITASIMGLIGAEFVMEWVRQYMTLPLAGWSSQFIAVHFCGGVLTAVGISVISAVFPIFKAVGMPPQEAMTRGEI
jgi:ABC-type lipoprotein release transport system permease subunit